jgi:hypothetical protein
MTRTELMRHALSQALRRVHVGAKKLKLDEETRWQIAGEAVEELRRYGGWKELDEEAPMRPLAPGFRPSRQGRDIEDEAGVRRNDHIQPPSVGRFDPSQFQRVARTANSGALGPNLGE